MITLPDYSLLVEPESILADFDEALRAKTNDVVRLGCVQSLFTGNDRQLRLKNQAGNHLDIANLSPVFNTVNYPMNVIMFIDANVLSYDDAEFLDDGVWALDDEHPTTVVTNPIELEEAINDLFQTDWVSMAICELLSNKPGGAL